MTIDEVAARRRKRAARRVGPGGGNAPLDLDPHSAYELLTRQMVQTLADELREIPDGEAKYKPVNLHETTRDADTYHLPRRRQYPQHITPSQGPGREKEKVQTPPSRARRLYRVGGRVMRAWGILLAVAAGVVTLGEAVQQVYGLIEWLLRLLNGLR